LQKLTVKSYRKFYVNFNRLFKKENTNGKKYKKNGLKENKDGLIETIRYSLNLFRQLRKEILKKAN